MLYHIFIYVYSEKSKRRTKTLANTNDPKWNQSFVYSSVRRADLKLRIVEITVWDYVRYGANHFLGEVRQVVLIQLTIFFFFLQLLF